MLLSATAGFAPRVCWHTSDRCFFLFWANVRITQKPKQKMLPSEERISCCFHVFSGQNATPANNDYLVFGVFDGKWNIMVTSPIMLTPWSGPFRQRSILSRRYRRFSLNRTKTKPQPEKTVLPEAERAKNGFGGSLYVPCTNEGYCCRPNSSLLDILVFETLAIDFELFDPCKNH